MLPLPIRPTPMQPSVMRLEGAIEPPLPSTEAGTIHGAERAAAALRLRKRRLDVPVVGIPVVCGVLVEILRTKAFIVRCCLLRALHSRHGLRWAFPSSLEAVSSPMTCSVSGFQRIFRPNFIAINPKCPGDAERWATSAGVRVGRRDLTHSRKLP